MQCVSAGVPQGSVLGPVLFLIFINDLYLGPFKGSFTAFADDTALAYGASDEDELHGFMQRDLRLLSLWFGNNKLGLNLEKTTFLNFSISRPFTFNRPLRFHSPDCSVIDCNCFILRQAQQVKYLGILVPDDLLWRNHIQELVNHLRLLLHRFYYLKQICPKFILRQVYFALAHSRLSYGIVCWGSTYVTHIKPAINIQKSLIKQIYGFRRFNYHDACRAFGVLPLRSLYIYKVLIQFYWSSGNRGLFCVDRPPNYNTRLASRFMVIPRPVSTFFQKSFLFLQGRFINFLPPALSAILLPSLFSRKLKAHILSLTPDIVDQMFTVIH